MKQVILRFQIAVLAILGVITLFSCTKTEEIDYQKDPQNKIVEFKITNSQQQLLAAIDQEKNTINVYIPYYLGILLLKKVGKGCLYTIFISGNCVLRPWCSTSTLYSPAIASGKSATVMV